MGKNILLGLVAGIVGLTIVKAFFLDPAEEYGWRLYWNAFFNGKGLDQSDWGVVIKSTTFIKCIGGLLTGSIVGFFVSLAMLPQSKTQPAPPLDKQSQRLIKKIWLIGLPLIILLISIKYCQTSARKENFDKSATTIENHNKSPYYTNVRVDKLVTTLLTRSR